MGDGLADHLVAARERVGLSQRTVAGRTGLSQATLSRIESGDRTPKANELLSLAWTLGVGIDVLTGRSTVADRVQCIARSTDDLASDGLRAELISLLEIDARLDDHGISRTP